MNSFSTDQPCKCILLEFN